MIAGATQPPYVALPALSGTVAAAVGDLLRDAKRGDLLRDAKRGDLQRDAERVDLLQDGEKVGPVQ
jgi:hypothetical protein